MAPKDEKTFEFMNSCASSASLVVQLSEKYVVMPYNIPDTHTHIQLRIINQVNDTRTFVC